MSPEENVPQVILCLTQIQVGFHIASQGQFYLMNLSRADVAFKTRKLLHVILRGRLDLFHCGGRKA